MRWFYVVVVGFSLLLLLGLLLLPTWLASSHLPGTDVSQFHATAVPAHVEDLRSEEASTRKLAATTLWQIGAAAQQATPALLQAAKDANPEVRAAVIKALGRTSQATQDALPALIEALKDENSEVRAQAANALAETWRTAGHAKSGAGRGPLGGAAEGTTSRGESRPIVRLPPTHEALAQKAVPLLTEALRDPDARQRAGAAEALAATGPLAEPAVAELVHILQRDADRETRLQATLALANIGPAAKAAVAVLVEKLRSEEAVGVRVNTAVTLGMIQSSPETVVPALVTTVLTDEDPDARLAAMGSLGRFGPEAGKIAVPLLQAATKDPANQQSPGTMQNINRLLKFFGKDAPGSVAEVPAAATGAPRK